MATAEQLARLKAVVPAAQATMAKWGVPASVTLAQWITESSWGTSKLAVAGNNFFGIKLRHTANPESYVELPTAEYENGLRVVVDALFEKYPSAAASFEAHAALLATASRYRNAMQNAGRPEEFAQCLQNARYSTNPRYAAEVRELMREFNLTQYDAWPPKPAAAAGAAA